MYPTDIVDFPVWVAHHDPVSASLVNNIQDQIEAIETELGTDPAGSVTDLKTRLSVSLNDDGTLKSITIFQVGSDPYVIVGMSSSNKLTISWNVVGNYAILQTTIGTLSLQPSSENVGIGTTIATAKLDVNGQIRMRTGASAGYFLSCDSTGLASWTSLSVVGASWIVSGNDIYNVNSGNVGIGTVNPLAKLDLNGQIQIRGGAPVDGYYLKCDANGLASWAVGGTGSSGATGVQGETGVQGTNGTNGQTGIQGLQGITGLRGQTGIQGLQGSTGVQGLRGQTGVQGLTGAQGLQGDTGLQGIQGNQGNTGLGTQGQTGLGVQGIQGATGVQGTQGQTGLSILGETGIQGLQGNTGIQGSQGQTGIQGQGITGIQGETGSQGTQGTTGIQGQGVTGSQGVTGIQGIQGTTGVQGLQGLTGVQGIQGSTGIQGFQGSTGVQGVQGATGIQGVQGTTGIQGLQGVTGVQGIQGTTGSLGIQGQTGVQGIIGNQGVTGLQGSTGVSLNLTQYNVPVAITSGSLGISPIYTDGSFLNVGIGSISPSAKLDVVGAAKISSHLTVGGNLTVNGTTTTINTETTNTDMLTITQDDNQSALVVSQITGSSSAAVMKIQNAGTGYSLLVDSGNVGIGTTTPSQALDVVGNVKVRLSNRVWTTPKVYNVLDYGAIPNFIATGYAGVTNATNNTLTQTGAFANVVIGDILSIQAQQIAGVVSVTNGSASVTGIDTAFQDQLSANDIILIQTREYRVGSISSQTSLTLAMSFEGVTGGAEPLFLQLDPTFAGVYKITGRTDNSVTVADITLTKLFGVVWFVYKDNRGAIQAACDAAAFSGGIVYVPEGIYMVYCPGPNATDNGLTVTSDVSLMGVNQNVNVFLDYLWESTTTFVRGTVLVCAYENVNESSAPLSDRPFICMRGYQVTVEGMQIYYPKQKYWRNTSSKITITNATYVTNFITFTAIGHGLVVGDVVMVTGVSPTGYNGPFVVRSLDIGDPTNKFVVYDGINPGSYVSGGFLYKKEPYKFPYTVKSEPQIGHATWEDHFVHNVHIVNPYYGIDFSSPHAKHRIDGFYASPLKEGITISGCGDVGKISHVELMPGNFFGYAHANNTSQYYRELFNVWTMMQSTGIHYYRTDGELDHDVFVYGHKYGFRFTNDVISGGSAWGLFTNFQTDSCDYSIYVDKCAWAGINFNNLRIIGWDVTMYGIPPVGNYLMGIYSDPANTGTISVTGGAFYGMLKNFILWNGGRIDCSNIQIRSGREWIDSGLPLPISIQRGTASLSQIEFQDYYNGVTSTVLDVGISASVTADGMAFGLGNTFTSTGNLSIITHKENFVGIGTVPSDQYLEVNNSWSNAGGNGIFIKNRYTGASAPTQILFDRSGASSALRASIGVDSTSRVFFIWVNNADRISIDASGNVGVGTSPVEKLHVQGNIRSSSLAGVGNRAVYSDTNGVLTNTSSDVRMKQDVEILSYGLKHVLRLRPVSYNWNSQYEEHGAIINLQKSLGSQREIGLIAQEVKEIIPEVIGENEDDTLSLDYPKLITVLINAIKEQQEMILNQQEQIDILNIKISKL